MSSGLEIQNLEKHSQIYLVHKYGSPIQVYYKHQKLINTLYTGFSEPNLRVLKKKVNEGCTLS